MIYFVQVTNLSVRIGRGCAASVCDRHLRHNTQRTLATLLYF